MALLWFCRRQPHGRLLTKCNSLSRQCNVAEIARMKGNVDLLLLGCVLGYFFLFCLHNCVYRPALFSFWARRSAYGVGWACENVQNQPIPPHVIVSHKA